jgi:hypothetical protein
MAVTRDVSVEHVPISHFSCTTGLVSEWRVFLPRLRETIYADLPQARQEKRLSESENQLFVKNGRGEP